MPTTLSYTLRQPSLLACKNRMILIHVIKNLETSLIILDKWVHLFRRVRDMFTLKNIDRVIMFSIIPHTTAYPYKKKKTTTTTTWSSTTKTKAATCKNGLEVNQVRKSKNGRVMSASYFHRTAYFDRCFLVSSLYSVTKPTVLYMCFWSQ